MNTNIFISPLESLLLSDSIFCEPKYHNKLLEILSLISKKEKSEKLIFENEPLFQELYFIYEKVLDQDILYATSILYFPFEYIPEKKDIYSSKLFNRKKNDFMKKYLSVWKYLINEYNYRVDFSNGDFPEKPKDVPQIVSKVTHFLPILMKKGWIDLKDIKEIVLTHPDILVLQGITEALYVCLSESLLSYEEIQVIFSESTFCFDELFSSFRNQEMYDEHPRYISLEEYMDYINLVVDSCDYSEYLSKHGLAWKKKSYFETISLSCCESILKQYDRNVFSRKDLLEYALSVSNEKDKSKRPARLLRTKNKNLITFDTII